MIIPELRDQIILVTGGANGIGAAIVRAFHAQGAQVHFCDTDQRAGRNLAKATGPKTHFAKVDLLSEQQIVKWIGTIRRNGKNIHALINNAARDPRIELGKTSVKDLDQLHVLNLRASFLTCREAVTAMPPGSAIVNLASITFHQGASGHCPRLAGGPEFVPVMVGAGFRKSTEVAHAFGCPKLAGPFEPALPLPTGRFHRAAANRPAAPVQAPVVHPSRVRGKIVLLALDHFTRWSSRQFQSGQPWLRRVRVMQPRWGWGLFCGTITQSRRSTSTLG